MMCSYTSVNGTAFCESAEWQQQWARQKMGFEGNIVTDCGALSMPKPSAEGSMDAAHNAAKGLAAGTDLNCGNGFDGKQHGYTAIAAAISSKLATEAQLDEVVGRSLGRSHVQVAQLRGESCRTCFLQVPRGRAAMRQWAA